MFPMTITIANTAQLNAVMAALNVDAQAPAPAGKPKAEAPTKKDEPKATPAPTDAAAPTAADTAPAGTAQSAQTGAAASYQDAATAITKLSRTKGRDAAVAVLAKFGAANLKDVKPEQFGAVVAAADEAMGA